MLQISALEGSGAQNRPCGACCRVPLSAGLHDRAAITGADLDDAVHAGERQHDAARLRTAAPSSVPARDQRHAMRDRHVPVPEPVRRRRAAPRLPDAGGAMNCPARWPPARCHPCASPPRPAGGQFGDQGSRQGRTHDGSERQQERVGSVSGDNGAGQRSHTQRSSESRVATPRALKNCGAKGETRIGRHGAKKRCSLHGQASATPRPPVVIASSSGWLAAQTKTNTAACPVDATVGPCLVGANLGSRNRRPRSATTGVARPTKVGDYRCCRPRSAATKECERRRQCRQHANSSEWLAPRWPKASA